MFTLSILVLLLLSTIAEAQIEVENEWTYYRKPPTTTGEKSCHFENRQYSSGQRISVDNPCIHCFCHEGKSDCYRQNCPPPPIGCEEITGGDHSCKNSIYNCTIPEKLQMPLLRREGKIYGQRKRGLGLVSADCTIRGIAYFVGETVGVATTNCLHCRCARASLLCTPLCCFEPVLPGARAVQASSSLYHRSVHPRDPHPLDHLE